MAVELQIFDGDPWWMSPDVWVVPGDDPEGFPGLPIAGSNAYLWARVHNTGTTAVQNATVRFYWADPSVGFDRTTATLIGSSSVTLNAGQTAEVLCLTPWVPVIVNDGHECVLAEAFHASDPLPLSPAFNVPTDRHVAQRNLSVLVATARMFTMRFAVHNTWRTERRFKLSVERGTLRQLQPLVKTLGKVEIPKEDGGVQHAGFTRERCPSEKDIKGAAPEMEVAIRPYGRLELVLVGEVRRGGALLHIVQSSADQITGGLSVLVIG